MIGITQQWQGKQLADAEYGRRVDAFWSFLTNETPVSAPDATDLAPPHDQAPPPPAPPPPAPPTN
jgi:hypothetical protein